MRSRTLILFAALAVLVAWPAAAEMTLDELLAKHIEAKGGMKAIKGIDSLKITAQMQMGPGMEAPLTMEMKRPDSLRVEFQLQGMTGIQAYDGETGWQVMPFTGQTSPQEITGSDLERLVEQADIDGPLVTFKERGSTAEYAGTEDVDGKQAHVVKITRESGAEATYLIDPETFLELKSRTQANMGGMDLQIEVSYEDYREVAGVMMAYKVSSQAVGTPMAQTLTIESVEANGEIAADRFAMPAAAEPEGQPEAEAPAEDSDTE